MSLDSAFPQTTLDVAEVWLSALRAAGRSPHTLANYRHATDKLAAWRGDPDLTTVSRFEALRFVQHLTDTYTPGGVANRVRSLRACFGWLVAEELVKTNAFARVRISVPAEAHTTASDEDIAVMLSRARTNRRDHAMLVLLCDTGARKREVASLSVADIDLTSGVVRFPVSKTVARTVPLSDKAHVALARWLRTRGTGTGSLWSVGDPYALVRQVVRRHSRGTLTPHSLRRHFAVSWLAKGGSETSLMRLAGWSSLAMVHTYVRARADVIASDEYRRLMA